MKTIFMIPFRDNGDPNRTANLKALEQYFKTHFREIPAMVVEQDAHQKWPDSFFIYNPKKFNKGWGLNVAAKVAIENGFTHLVFWDADFVMSPDQFRVAMKAIEEDHGFDAISPYGRAVTYMNQQESAAFHQSLDCGFLQTLPPRRESRAQQSDLPLAAGIFCITAEGFKKVGGYPENFEGWGGEDCALSFKIYKTLGHMTFQEHRAFHMWHDDPVKTADFGRFGKIWKASSKAPDLVLSDAITEWPTIGNPHKYR